MCHIVDAVQIAYALLIEHILTLAPYDLQWIRAVEELTGLTAFYLKFCWYFLRRCTEHKIIQ